MHRWHTRLVLIGLVGLLVGSAALSSAADPVGAANPTIGRNLASSTEKGIVDDFSIKKGAEKNIKWSIQLGSKAYGGPVISGGKIFIGTNNNVPRNNRDVDAGGDPIDIPEGTASDHGQSLIDRERLRHRMRDLRQGHRQDGPARDPAVALEIAVEGTQRRNLPGERARCHARLSPRRHEGTDGPDVDVAEIAEARGMPEMITEERRELPQVPPIGFQRQFRKSPVAIERPQPVLNRVSEVAVEWQLQIVDVGLPG